MSAFPTPEQIAQMEERRDQETARLRAEENVLRERLKNLGIPDTLIPDVCRYDIPISYRAWVKYCEETPPEKRLWYENYFKDIWAK